MSEKKLEKLILKKLKLIGEDTTREGLQDTPCRVARSYNDIFAGYTAKPNLTVFTNESDKIDQIVGLSNIEFYSTCEHHMLPFFGIAHIYYIPNEKIIGISKLARILDLFAKRMQNQERVGKQVADLIEEILKPKGIAVIIEAKHLCMMSRGVGKQNSVMKTSELRGAFRDNSDARHELFNLIK